MKSCCYIVTLLLLWVLCPDSYAQTPMRLRVFQVAEQRDTIPNHLLPANREVANLPELYDHLEQWQQQRLQEGYLAASVDTLYYADSVWQAYVFVGPKYQWARLHFDSLPPAIIQNAGLREQDWTGKAINPRKLATLQHQLLQYCENNGFPFAQTRLQVIAHQQQGVEARMLLTQGAYTLIDTIIVEGNIALSTAFLFNYLDLHPGDPYDESKMKKLSKQLSELDFVAEERPWEMHFTIGAHTLYLYLKEKKSNQFNALVGLQPNTELTGKFMITADMLLALKNSFGMGESIAASFQNLQFQSPRLHLEAGLPFILGSPFGLEGSFDLFKRDTTFVRVSFEAGIRYQLNVHDYLLLSYQHFTNRMISFNESEVISKKMLPENVDMQTQGLAMRYVLTHTDYRLNPRKGWEAGLSLAGLLRKVKENPAITGIVDGSGYDYNQLYDSAGQQVVQYRLEAMAAYYFPLGKQLAIKLGYDGGYLAGGGLFQNELYQIGGFKRLRGFDEQSIFANQYHIATVELRLLLANNSRFFLFADQAYVQTKYALIADEGFPLGLGAGLNLDTGGGLFNIAIGVGKRSGQTFQLRQTKIHFGYIAYF